MMAKTTGPAAMHARLLTIKDVADRLKVSIKTVRRWIDRGELVAYQLGHQWRIAEPDLSAFLAVRRGVNLVSGDDHYSPPLSIT
jgi:excisionase family DNA binding protein